VLVRGVEATDQAKKSPVSGALHWCRHHESNAGPIDYKWVNYLSLSMRKCLQDVTFDPCSRSEVYLPVSSRTHTFNTSVHFLVHFEHQVGLHISVFGALVKTILEVVFEGLFSPKQTLINFLPVATFGQKRTPEQLN